MREKLSKEIWKAIPDYSGLYEISNHKRIRSLNREIKRKVNGKKYSKNLKGKILKSTNGYSVILSKNNQKKRVEIDRIFEKTFNGIEYDKHEKIFEGKLIDRREFTSNNHIGKDGHSIYTGVSYNIKYHKWCSSILIKKNRVHLGVFESELDAKIMYEKAKRNMHLYKGIPKYFRTMLNQVHLNEKIKESIIKRLIK